MTTSHWWKHPTIFAAVIGAIGMMIVAVIQLTPLLLSSPKPGRFSYSVRVEMKNDRKIINNAKVSITVEGKTPLIEFTDVNGFSIFFIEADYAGSHGTLIVEASGFSVYNQNVNIFPDKLPAVVQLEAQKQPSAAIEISSTEAPLTNTPIPPTNTPIAPTNTPIAPASTTIPSITAIIADTSMLCPDYISRDKIKKWTLSERKNAGDIPSYINEFNSYRSKGGDDPAESIIPANIIIATDFGAGNSLIWQSYPVKPLVHYRSSGIFETTGEFKAPHAGACMSIMPSIVTVTDSSLPLTVCGPSAFAGNNITAKDLLFKRPEGYTSGWISSDPLEVVLPDGTSQSLGRRHILIVDDLPDVQLKGVPLGKIYGCWYRTDLTLQVISEAERKLSELKAEAPLVPAVMYRISKRGLEQVE